ncbi:MAG: 30S ribosomal protein S17, partial [Candidatus Aenigmarchaeota archaeon]|nr:30S ribosomal protein S17 [Candidatus Aenigmarchaeota archaeon]
MTENVGIKGIKPPKEGCSDRNCPFHGTLSVRGRIFKGVVTSAKMEKSVKVSFERIIRVSKFERFEKRSTKLTAHNPPCIGAEKGDNVVIMECRPIS